ncbi:FYN-binding protein 1 isoform X3 [Lissotriton helveticus]
MERFKNGSTATEDAPPQIRNFKAPGQYSTTQVPSALAARKAALEHLGSPNTTSGATALQKGLKPTIGGVKIPPEEETGKDSKPPYAKPNSALNRYVGSISAAKKEEGHSGFPNTVLRHVEAKNEDTKPVFLKSAQHKPGNGHEIAAPKVSFPLAQPKPFVPKTPFTGAHEENGPKDVNVKKQAVGQKLSLTTNPSQNEESASVNNFLPRGPTVPKTSKPAFLKPIKDPVESANSPEHTSQPFGVALRATTGPRSIQSPFLPTKTDESNGGKKNVPEDNSTTTANIFPKQAPKFRAESMASSQKKPQQDKGSAVPKRIPLKPLFMLGTAPQKPNRPPNVDLDKFRNKATGDSSSKGISNISSASHSSANAALPPPPLPTHPTAQAIAPPPPPHPAALPSVPSLPPRNFPPATESQAEESYDDVLFEGNSFNSTGDVSGDQDDEIYEGIDESNSCTKEDEKRREKEDKRRQEQEKKEQKKEQEIRKKFKLVGPIEVLHQAKACVDCKGGKNELSFKQGDSLEIIRVTDNPEGKWLARKKGTYGYIKTTSVEIDYSALKKKDRHSVNAPMPTGDDQDVYDDVAEQDNISRHLPGNSSGSMLPPPPIDDDIYDGIDEPTDISCVLQEEEKSWTQTLLKKIKGRDDKGKSAKDNASVDNEAFVVLAGPPPPPPLKDSGEGEVYDDVASQDFPPAPKEFNTGLNMKHLSFRKNEDKDPKKMKKMEKEEKEFRKKFKYDGEINVINSAHVSASMSTKKWGAKDLPVKPGELVEIIQDTDESKVLCRNDEGKYGYVMRSNLVFGNGGEIYDDVDDGCIYDND